MSSLTLKLDDRQSWVITQMLELCLSNPDSFISTDENDEETYDEELHNETKEIYDLILKKRGFK